MSKAHDSSTIGVRGVVVIGGVEGWVVWVVWVGGGRFSW